MNQYLILASYDENEMQRHLARGEDQLLDIIEKNYLNSSAALEVYVLDGAVNPITTNASDLIIMADARQKARQKTSRHLEKFARDVAPRFVIVVGSPGVDVAFGATQLDAIESFVASYTDAKGGPVPIEEVSLVRQAIKVREYNGSSYPNGASIEVDGDDARFDQAFAGLTAAPTLKV